MKRLFLGSILALIIIVIVTGCGKGDYAGTYTLEYTKYVGDNVKNTSEGGKIILNEDGTGKNRRDGRTIEIEWEIDGDNIKIIETTEDIEYNGTIEDDKLTIYDGDKSNALTKERVYRK